MPSWWNGRHASLKNWSPERGVKVRILLGVPFLLILACAAGPLNGNLSADETVKGCEDVIGVPTTSEEWAYACYCAPDDDAFTYCIDNWTSWHRNKHP